jgi:hypothetical protein
VGLLVVTLDLAAEEIRHVKDLDPRRSRIVEVTVTEQAALRSSVGLPLHEEAGFLFTSIVAATRPHKASPIASVVDSSH